MNTELNMKFFNMILIEMISDDIQKTYSCHNSSEHQETLLSKPGIWI